MAALSLTLLPLPVTAVGEAVTVSESGGSTNVVEGESTGDTYTLVLDVLPTADVTVTIAPDSQVVASVSSLTFTTSTWNVPQTIIVGVINDAVVEGPHTGTITHVASGGGYDGVSVADVVVSVTDDDSPSVTIVQTADDTFVSEGGSQDTYTVVLGRQPSGSVTVNAVTTTQISVAPMVLTFTTTTWDTPQTITVSALNDQAVEGTHFATISHSATGGSYGGVSISSVQVEIHDDDLPGVTLVESGGSTQVTEGGATDTYTLRLNTQPQGTVTVTLATDSHVTANPSPLLFTTTTWSVDQVVTVAAVNDSLAEGSMTSVVSHTITGEGYESVSIPDVSVAVIDNDTPIVTITESDGSTDVDESGVNDTYTVVLATPPSGTVTFSPSTDGQVTTSPAAMTFSTSTWDLPRTVTVQALNDDVVEGESTSVITHSTTGGGYDGATVPSITVNVADNEVPVVLLTETGGITIVAEIVPGEGGPGQGDSSLPLATETDSYDLVLNAVPSGNVTVAIIPDGQVTLSDASVVFTPTDWNVSKTITVTVVDDSLVEGFHTSTIQHSISGGGYDEALEPVLKVSIVDNDDPSLRILQPEGRTEVNEDGSTDVLEVVLEAPPSGTVIVTLQPDAQVTLDALTLIFTTSTWDAEQTVLVEAVDDTFVEGPHTGNVLISASGGGYDELPDRTFVVNVLDNEVGGVDVIESAGSTDVTEDGATDLYGIVLSAQPSGTVTVTIEHDDQIEVSPTLLTFTTSTWNTTQSVNVAAVDDVIVEGAHTGRITHEASGGGYDRLSIADVVVNIRTDNDLGSVTITELGGSTRVTEGGPTDGYTIVLGAAPTGVVTVGITPEPELTVDRFALQFNPINWNVPQTVTITAVDDTQVEGAHDGIVRHEAVGGGYEEVQISELEVAIVDDDASVVLVESDGFTEVSEGGDTDVYTLVLDAEPSGTITVTLDLDTQIRTGSTTVFFTPSNWDVPQTLTVTAVDDDTVEGPHIANLRHLVQGIGYDGVLVPSVAVAITDDDEGFVDVIQSEGVTQVSEGGRSDSYEVVLGRQPVGNVAVTITTDRQVDADKFTLAFNPSTWDIPQVVTVTAVDDSEVEGPHVGRITHEASGPEYDDLTVPGVIVNVSDNDRDVPTPTPSTGLAPTPTPEAATPTPSTTTTPTPPASPTPATGPSNGGSGNGVTLPDIEPTVSLIERLQPFLFGLAGLIVVLVIVFGLRVIRTTVTPPDLDSMPLPPPDEE